MKTNHPRQIQWAIFFAIALIAGHTSAFAQEDKAEELDFETKVETVKIYLEFDRPQPLGDFLSGVQEVTPFPLNVVIQRGAKSVEIPPMDLKQVSVTAVLNAAAEATGQELEWYLSQDKKCINIARNPDFEEEPSSVLLVVNVSKIVQRMDLKVLQSAIEMGLEMQDGDRDEIKVKFHEPTKLLFIKGSVAELDVVKQVIDQLGGSPFERSSWHDHDDHDESQDEAARGGEGGRHGGGVF